MLKKPHNIFSNNSKSSLKINIKIGILFFIAVFFSNCNKPKIVLLCSNEYTQSYQNVYLVKNPPHSKLEFEKLMVEFNKDLKPLDKYVMRIFMKEHENSLFDKVMRDEINYSKNGCKVIDNIDYICTVSKVKFKNGGDTIVYDYHGKYQ